MVRLGLLFPGQGFHHLNTNSYHLKSFETLFNACNIEASGFIDAIKTNTVSSCTQFVQMNQYATSICALQKIADIFESQNLLNKTFSFVTAGHSLGAITAIVAANFLSPHQGISIISERGKSMSGYSDEGSMISITLKPDSSFYAIRLALIDAMSKNKELSSYYSPKQAIANIACYNSHDQLVLSGTTSLLNSLIEGLLKDSLITENDIKSLPVTGPFHSPLINQAADKFGESLETIQLVPPPVEKSILPGKCSYFSSSLLSEKTEYFSQLELKTYLRSQITAPVYWIQTLDTLIQNYSIDFYIEVGGRSLAAMLRRSYPHIKVIPAQFNSIFDEEKFLEAIGKVLLNK